MKNTAHPYFTVLGIDIGTTGIALAAIDARTGGLLEQVHATNRYETKPGVQDAEGIADAVTSALAGLARRHAVAAVGLCGQMHGILYVDGEGKALSPLYTWQYQPGDDAWLKQLSERTGHALAWGYGSVTHAWLAREGLAPADAAAFCTIADYAGMRLAGRRTPLMHASNAHSLGLYDAPSGGWDEAAIARAGLTAELFPAVRPGAVLLGQSAEGFDIAVAIGDNQASFIGSVREPERSVLVNVGTGSQVSALAARGSSAPGFRPLNGDEYLTVGSALCGGRAYALLKDFFLSCAELMGGSVDDEALYAAMNAAGEAALGLSDKLQVTPLFSGTREAPDLRASIGQISPGNFTARHLVGGLIEGMAEELHQLYRLLPARACPAPGILVGAGGALRQNPALRKAIEARFGLPVHLPRYREEAAYGAALFACAAAGRAPSLQAAQGLVRYE
ncbi:MAG: sedoheptulokinase [Christensenellales bacterium]|jgi:sedoheptulokinase